MSVLAEFSVMPVGVGESISKYVAHAVEIVDKSGLSYKLCPMGTVIEGEWDQVFGVIKQCQERLAQECNRAVISIRVDWRKGQARGLEQNVEHVQQHLGKKART